MNEERYRELLPPITAANQPFWDGCSLGELRLQTCTNCEQRRYPESPLCPRCLSTGFTWQAVSGRGTLWSWIVMHQNYLAAFADELPYNVAFVRLEEGPYLMTSLVQAPAEVRVDSAVEAVFVTIGGRSIPKFRLSES